MTPKFAELSDGKKVQYVETDDPPAGAMKETYFSPDRSYVVQFFKNTKTDSHRIRRLMDILARYNLTKTKDNKGFATNQESADYFKNLFCWPTGIVTQPRLGITAPVYPGNFFFSSGSLQGKEKNSRWFFSPKCMKNLSLQEKGTLIDYFKICISLARAIRRMHQGGLAHSDLSDKNVLIDPIQGKSIIIDIDSLVVPGLYPPDVLGTPDYIAPEVMATMHLPIDHADRIHPSIRTDLHALAVLLYQYLFFRHPLKGDKVNSIDSTEEDEILSMGSKALFIENPLDKSNRPKSIKVPYAALGKQLAGLFEKAFITGLSCPNDRPTAFEWEKALQDSFEMLCPCPNEKCTGRWFVYDMDNQKKIKCPYCGFKIDNQIPIMTFLKQSSRGVWEPFKRTTVYHGKQLFGWHVNDNVFPGENADLTPLGSLLFYEGNWVLMNEKLLSMSSPSGNRVLPGQATALIQGGRIKLANEEHGQMALIDF